MNRILSIDKVREAAKKVFDNNAGYTNGKIDTTYNPDNKGGYALAIALTDGTVIALGDADRREVLGSIVQIPMYAALYTQLGRAGFVAKSGECPIAVPIIKKPSGLPVGARGIRMASAIEPLGDNDGKMKILTDLITAMVGTNAELNDKVYENLIVAAANADTVNTLAKAEYFLYDDAEASVDLYAKLKAMSLSISELAMMGATVAADGRCPVNGVPAFDGEISQDIVAAMAAHGVHKYNKPYLMNAQIPGRSSKSGTILAILPGTMAIAAFAPEVDEKGTSLKAMKTVVELANELDISAFASARVVVK